MNLFSGGGLLAQDVVNQIVRTDRDYEMIMQFNPPQVISSLDKNLKVGLLKHYGEIMEGYLKAILWSNGYDKEFLKQNAGHKLVKLYNMLDDVSKSLVEIETMGADKRGFPKMIIDLVGNTYPYNWVTEEPMISNAFDDVVINKEITIESIEEAFITNSSFIIAKKKMKPILSGKKEYEYKSIIQQLSNIKTSDFRYSDVKNEIDFSNEFMAVINKLVISIHNIARIERLEIVNGFKNETTNTMKR